MTLTTGGILKGPVVELDLSTYLAIARLNDRLGEVGVFVATIVVIAWLVKQWTLDPTHCYGVAKEAGLFRMQRVDVTSL